jgi:hypothetical protein
MNKFDLNSIQVIALLIPVFAAVIGGGNILLHWYQQPDLTNGKYFESAWFDYGEAENVLNVVHIPDETGFRMFLAVHEAIDRIEHKSWINPDIDTKPISVNIYIPEDADLVKTGTVMVSGKTMHQVQMATHKERIEDMSEIFAYSELDKLKNMNEYPIIYENGTVGHVEADDHYKYWSDEGTVLRIYSNETLQNMIDQL